MSIHAVVINNAEKVRISALEYVEEKCKMTTEFNDLFFEFEEGFYDEQKP